MDKSSFEAQSLFGVTETSRKKPFQATWFRYHREVSSRKWAGHWGFMCYYTQYLIVAPLCVSGKDDGILSESGLYGEELGACPNLSQSPNGPSTNQDFLTEPHLGDYVSKQGTQQMVLAFLVGCPCNPADKGTLNKTHTQTVHSLLVLS